VVGKKEAEKRRIKYVYKLEQKKREEKNRL
jgi:hypothetical protein